jgi:hypothetical protein
VISIGGCEVQGTVAQGFVLLDAAIYLVVIVFLFCLALFAASCLVAYVWAWVEWNLRRRSP